MRNQHSLTDDGSESPQGLEYGKPWIRARALKYMSDFLGEPLLVIAVTGCLGLGVYLGIEHLKEHLRERRLQRERQALRRQFWGSE